MVLSRTIGGGTCVTKCLSLIVFAEPGDQQPVPNTKENDETSTVKKKKWKKQGSGGRLPFVTPAFHRSRSLFIYMCFMAGLCFRKYCIS